MNRELKVGDTVKVDNRTKKWLRERPGIQTTMVQCKKCGLHYKPSLGHKCKKGGGQHDD